MLLHSFVGEGCPKRPPFQYVQRISGNLRGTPIAQKEPDNISLLRSPENEHNQVIRRSERCGSDHYGRHSHIRQFFICVFQLSFVGIVAALAKLQIRQTSKNTSLDVLKFTMAFVPGQQLKRVQAPSKGQLGQRWR